MYNYNNNIINDIHNYLRETYSKEELAEKLLEPAEFEDELNEALWADDSVTGNASGSYTFSSYTAQEYLVGNWDLLREALQEFGGADRAIEEGPEFCDVTIRCYLLSGCINTVINELIRGGRKNGKILKRIKEAH